jgi:hypothetical protein
MTNHKLLAFVAITVPLLLLVLLTSVSKIPYAVAQAQSANETLYANGYGEANREYSNYLAANADTGFNGAPHSMNYSYAFTLKQTDIHGPFAQGYYDFLGMKDSYTKTHDILGIEKIQHETPGGGLLDQEVITFGNGTEITIPEQNIGFYHGTIPFSH